MAASPNMGSLQSKTRSLLQSCEKGYPHIYKETGLPQHWLRKFAAGEFRDPSVNRVQTLYEYLTGRSLDV